MATQAAFSSHSQAMGHHCRPGLEMVHHFRRLNDLQTGLNRPGVGQSSTDTRSLLALLSPRSSGGESYCQCRQYAERSTKSHYKPPAAGLSNVEGRGLCREHCKSSLSLVPKRELNEPVDATDSLSTCKSRRLAGESWPGVDFGPMIFADSCCVRDGGMCKIRHKRAF